jgi:hypothetical protein
VFRLNPDNVNAHQHFAWNSNEDIEKMLLQQRGPQCRVPAGDFPAHTDILTYILITGLG